MSTGSLNAVPSTGRSTSVPTGNFGNVYAARVAQRMGAPVERLVVATNCNAILAQFINEASMTTVQSNRRCRRAWTFRFPATWNDSCSS